MGVRPETSRPVVAFFGLFGVGNFGNEASLRAVREAVAELLPDARLVCVAEVPENVTAEHGLPAVSNRMAGWLDGLRPRNRALRLLVRPLVECGRWVAAIRFLRGVDVVIVPGTGILDDFGVRPWQMPYDLFRWSAACRLTRTRLAFLSIGAGPIHDRWSRRLMKGAVGCARYVSYRDRVSYDFMESIGRDVRGDRVEPDLVLGLPVPADRRCEEGRTVIGVGVMAYRGWSGRGEASGAIYEEYIGKVSELCRALLESGHLLRMLIGEHSDREALEEVAGRLAKSGCDVEGRVTVPRIESVGDLLEAVGEVDVMIATRYHNVVAAVMMERPVVSLGYARKNEDLLANVGLAGYCQHVESFDVQRALRDLSAAVERREELAGEACRYNSAAREALAAQYHAVLGAFTCSRSGAS